MTSFDQNDASSPPAGSVNNEPNHVLDASGLFCPEPVMLLHNIVRSAKAGELISVVATDPSTTRDIPKFCNFLGHELIATSEEGKKFYFTLRKGKD